MAKWANPRKIKAARTYTIEELAQKLGVAIVTVRSWEKQGLRVLKSSKPFLILGQDARDFLERKRNQRRQSLKPGQFRCFTCKRVDTPLGLMADYLGQSTNTGRLVALCRHCDNEMHLFTSKAKLPKLQGILDIAIRGTRHA